MSVAPIPPRRRRQDFADGGLPLYQRTAAVVGGVALVVGAMYGAAWLWNQSGVAAVVRDGSPNWSADGRRVVFTSETNGKADLFITNLSGGDRQELTHTPADEGGPAFSPNGEWLAFHSDREGNFEIYVMRADGTEARRLTADPGTDQAPTWSRDGTQIIFTSDRAGEGFDVYRMSADGAGLERLTTGGGYWFPQYSPDGGQLALHIERDVYIMSLSSRAFRRLTHEPANGLYPTWSPDGLRLAFMSWRNGRTEIFVARSDGSEPRVVVTMPTGDAVDPRWSPDGRHLAFVHIPEGGLTPAQAAAQQRIVFIVELESGRLTRISR